MTEPEVVDTGRPKEETHRPIIKPGTSRIESGSVFYTHLVPVILGALALITIVLIVIAAGVLIGVIPFQ